jgi:hypothetical protein
MQVAVENRKTSVDKAPWELSGENTWTCPRGWGLLKRNEKPIIKNDNYIEKV